MKDSSLYSRLTAWGQAIAVSGHAATHPWAMSYALGLRVPKGSKHAQDGTVIFGATTDQIVGRLSNSGDSDADEAWKAGQSAADAYGYMIEAEFGSDAIAKLQDFGASGVAWIDEHGMTGPFAALVQLFPELRGKDLYGHDDPNQTRANIYRYVLGQADPAAQALESPMPTLSSSAAPTLFNLVAQRKLSRARDLTLPFGTVRQGAGPTEPAPAPAPSSSAAPIGGVAGALLGGVAGYMLGGRSVAIAGIGAAAGGVAGYLGGALAK